MVFLQVEQDVFVSGKKRLHGLFLSTDCDDICLGREGNVTPVNGFAVSASKSSYLSPWDGVVRCLGDLGIG